MTGKLLSVMIGVLIGASCAEAPTGAPPSVDPLLVKLARAGFDTVGAKDTGQHYIIEGDIRISKSYIAERLRLPEPISDPGVALQFHTTSLVSLANAGSIKVDLSNLSGDAAWQTAARNALAEWNDAGSYVAFEEGTPADITFYTYSVSDGTVAYADWPDNDQPGTYVYINLGSLVTPNNGLTKLRNVVHELGHTLGLRHTNAVDLWEPLGSSAPGGWLVPGTDSTDAASVMNGGTADYEWAGFSADDLVAITWLYPPVLVTINGLSEVRSYHTCWWNSSVSGPVSASTYEWSQSFGGGYSYVGSDDWYEFESGQAGTDFNLRLVVTDVNGRTWPAYKAVTVSSSAPIPWEWCS